MTEGNDGGEGCRGGEGRRQVAHAEAGCDWWMKGVGRMKGEIEASFHIEGILCQK